MRREWILPAVAVAISLVAAVTASGWLMARGRINVLTEQVVVLEEVRDGALEGEAEAIVALAESFEEAEEERVVAVAEIAEAHAETIVQQAEAEAAFRRAESLASDNPILERAIQEMRAEAIVTEMALEDEIETTASALLTAQLRIGTLEVRVVSLVDEVGRVNAAWRAEVSIKDQIIVEQGRALSLSFFPNLFKNAELVVVGAVVGGAITYVVVSP